MIPRGRPDIGWSDLLHAMLDGIQSGDSAPDVADGSWAAPGRTLACLSLRSGFDAVLQALVLPRGSKVLVSEVTIPDMILILKHHGLVPVPLRVRQDSLAVDAGEMEAHIDDRTRAVLIAHLFGSRMPMDDIAACARRHSLMLFEDCAQAFDGSGYRGHPDSDVSMFSFGPIKTATALGGAMLLFRDEQLLRDTAKVCDQWPVQSRPFFLKRVLKFAVVKMIATETGFGLFYRACRIAGKSHDELLRAALRGFHGDLFAKIRQRPCEPLLRLLARRLSQPHEQRIRHRAQRTENLRARLNGLAFPGSMAANHSHWVMPVQSHDPDALVTYLQAAGYDSTRYGSSMTALESGISQPPHWIQNIVYLPSPTGMEDETIERLADLVALSCKARGQDALR